jgi:UDPglucose--hexose-1-phosphate uridylyltransferase
MPELRRDPIVGRWVIIATERSRRPTDFISGDSEIKSGVCPFCEGQENKTPPEIMAYRKPGTARNTPGWLVRVVPNKFPALAIEGNLNRTGIGLFDMMNGIGAHEVIIESPDHARDLSDQSVEQLEKILMVFRDRLIDLQKDVRFRYILIFKNHGQRAGTSLSHPHSQIIATPVMPSLVREELIGAGTYYKNKERCIFCDIIKQELSQGERVISENADYILLAPYASRFPFETWLLPRYHSHDFTEMSRNQVQTLAPMLKDALTRLKRTLNDPPYNFVLHTAPNIIPRPGHPEYWGSVKYDWHWHIEIIPRVTRIAGFEWGSGFYINPTSPEEVTKYLREVPLDEIS